MEQGKESKKDGVKLFPHYIMLKYLKKKSGEAKPGELEGWSHIFSTLN